ncbi:MAG: hypothetical protein ACJAT1_001710 [Marivirga sp.]|jgi:hypothetical protein
MKTYSKISFIVIVLFGLVASSCKEDDKQDCTAVACTEEFRTITLTVSDQNGDPVIFDDYYTFIDSRNRFKIEQDVSFIAQGIYPVASDAELNQLSFEGTILTFVGEIDDQNIIEHQMLIGKDCCHISLISGEMTVQID